MILVKVELHSARTGKVTEIGRMEISNDGTSRHPAVGNYRVERYRRGSTSRVLKRGAVLGHRRKSQTIWKLLQKAIASVT